MIFMKPIQNNIVSFFNVMIDIGYCFKSAMGMVTINRSLKILFVGFSKFIFFEKVFIMLINSIILDSYTGEHLDKNL